MTTSISPAIQEISDILKQNYVFINEFELTPLNASYVSVQIFNVRPLASGGQLVVCAGRKCFDDDIIRLATHIDATGAIRRYQF